MKNQLLPLAIFALLALAFTSCEKEPDTVEISIQQTPPQESDPLAQINESVLFLYDFESATSGERTGFFIDKKGNLTGYSVPADETRALPLHGSWTKEDINKLLSVAGTQLINVPAEDLSNYHRKIGRASLGKLTDYIEQPDQSGTATYLALQWEMIHESNGGCEPGGYSHDNNVGEIVHNVITLKSEGSILQENTQLQAKEITTWLKSLQVEAGL